MESFVSVKKLRKVVGRLLSSNGSVGDFNQISELVETAADWGKLVGDKQVVVEFETPIDPPFKFKRQLQHGEPTNPLNEHTKLPFERISTSS